MTAQFDFITDNDFRSILTADYVEMRICADSKAWKAVHVLAGSIIEAVIVDYLIAEHCVSRKDGVKLQLGEAIDSAVKSGILPKDLCDLSSVIKDYRNLVHPGRSIRLEKKPDYNSSSVAMSLVDMICNELGNRKGSRGYTAEQIISKVRRDASAAAILQNLLKEVPSDEIHALLIKAIPETYRQENKDQWFYEEGDNAYQHVLPTLRSLFRIAYSHADKNTQRDVALNFVRIVKEEDSEVVTQYGDSFWWMGQMEHLCDDDIQVIKNHFLSRVESDRGNEELITILRGIGKYLSPEEAQSITNLLMSIRLLNAPRAGAAASRVLQSEYPAMDADSQSQVLIRLDQLRQRFERSGKDDYALTLAKEKDLLEIPF